MTEKDYDTMDGILETVHSSFPEGVINTLEIGVHHGLTSRGIRDFFKSKARINFHSALDNQQDFKMDTPFPECDFIVGDSLQVAEMIRDRSQHFIFIDANHSFRYVISDFIMYKEKVVAGGYMAFHDVSPHIAPFTDYQQVGAKENPYNYISCYEAVQKLGLLDNRFLGWSKVVFNYDETKPTGGILLVKKID